jgi:predicted aconitase
MDWLNSAMEFLKSPAGLALLAVAATLVAKKYPAIGALIMAWVKSKTPAENVERTQVMDAIKVVQVEVATKAAAAGREEKLKTCDEFKALTCGCLPEKKEAVK